MIRIAAVFILVGGAFLSKAQTDSLIVVSPIDSTATIAIPDSLTSAKIVLLKNTNDLLPLKHLESLSIHYLNNPLLEQLGSRYSENNSSRELHISSVSGNDKVEAGRGILVIYGDSISADSLELSEYEAIIYSSYQDSIQSDLISQMMFGGRAFTDTFSTDKYGFKSGSGIITDGGLRFTGPCSSPLPQTRKMVPTKVAIISQKTSFTSVDFCFFLIRSSMIFNLLLTGAVFFTIWQTRMLDNTGFKCNNFLFSLLQTEGEFC